MFDEPSAVPKDVHSTLQTVVDFVPPDGGVAVRGDPHAGVLVGVDLVLDKLAHAVLVDVDAACLPVVDLAANHRGVSLGLHLKAGDAVVVDVIGLKITLEGGGGAA